MQATPCPRRWRLSKATVGGCCPPSGDATQRSRWLRRGLGSGRSRALATDWGPGPSRGRRRQCCEFPVGDRAIPSARGVSIVGEGASRMTPLLRSHGGVRSVKEMVGGTQFGGATALLTARPRPFPRPPPRFVVDGTSGTCASSAASLLPKPPPSPTYIVPPPLPRPRPLRVLRSGRVFWGGGGVTLSWIDSGCGCSGDRSPVTIGVSSGPVLSGVGSAASAPG